MPTTSEKIIFYLRQKGHVTGAELADYLGITRQGLFKHLPKLISSGVIAKIGKPPQVFYFINTSLPVTHNINIPHNLTQQINKHFLIITPAGEKKEGMAGFVYWCEKNNLSYKKTAEEYNTTLQKYHAYKKNGLIDGMTKMKNTFPIVYLDRLFYVDFYSIERFGKTKLGQLLLYAKQSQNLQMMNEIISFVKPNVDAIIKKYYIDGIGFIPPTVKRERQLMRVLEKGLHENVRKISIIKIKTEVAVPQKTLTKLNDRIENARNTLVVNEEAHFKNILLIDDAVGSGATLNDIAKKIREKGICQGKIIGLSLTGSFKGFDVISEV
ncbi:MAG: HTH domain-containing protein [Candidatus Magasanikbacteria bacterium]|nr:HTH domain-containing protein [Candidatus Magasanikbacteria bacterium]